LSRAAGFTIATLVVACLAPVPPTPESPRKMPPDR